ncbi:MAG: TonB family protein [Candidatus Rokubacteria bacterium]|nr:TonB family protein [Candidatus Rokubacteria bacterium]
MAVAVATVRPRSGPALRRLRVPVGGLALSVACHGVLLAAVLVAGHVWRTTQPKTYVVNLVPAIAAVGSPRGRTTTETKPPALPEREPARAPEKAAARPTDLPDRAPAPRESASLPDRSLPTRAPELPRPGEKELPQVASTKPPPPSSAPVGRTAPTPPPPRGLPTGSPQGVGTLTLNAADFPFAWYLRLVQGKIGERWDPVARDGTQPQVVFEIGRDGKIAGLKVEKSSGNPLYDQAALRAITEATPFPPLPEAFKASFLRVHLGFTYAGTRG